MRPAVAHIALQLLFPATLCQSRVAAFVGIAVDILLFSKIVLKTGSLNPSFNTSAVKISSKTVTVSEKWALL